MGRSLLLACLTTLAGSACGDDEPEALEPRCDADGVARGDDTLVRSRAEAEALTGCTEIEGSLLIGGPDITDLRPLSSVRRVGRELQIRDAVALGSLQGLGAVEEIAWGLEVSGCDLLETLDDLESLSFIG